MQTYLLTRGVGRDYGFLGSPPAEPWWREFGQLTAFEQPTLLIHADRTGWQMYASAIPTTRRDRTNTRIRLSLVLVGEHQRPAVHTPTSAAGAAPDESDEHPVPDELSGVLVLVQSWLAGPTASASDKLAALLDEQFPADDTERLISTAGQGNDDEVDHRVRRVLDKLGHNGSRSDNSANPASAQSDSWLGDVAVPAVRAAFFRQAQALLLGANRGWAVQLNLASAAELRAYFERQPGPLVALLDERVPGGLSELRPKAVTPTRARSPVASRTRVLVTLAAVLLIGLIVWLLTYFRSPPPAPLSLPQPQPPQPTLPSPPQSQPTLPGSSTFRFP